MKHWLKRALTAFACVLMGITMTLGISSCNGLPFGNQSSENSESSSEHVHTYVETVVEATCTAEGQKTLTCECGDVKTETIEKLAHTFTKQEVSDKYIAAAATCTSGATYYYSCTVCGTADTKTFVVGDPTSHTWESKAEAAYLVSEATCTERAIYTKSCATCGTKGSETFAYGEKKAHTWAEIVEDKYFVSNATCETPKTYAKGCSVCGSAEGEHYYVGEKLGHDYKKETIPVSCFVDGYDSYTCERCHHTYADLESVVKAAGEHTHTAVVTEPTCTTQGYTTYTCVCGDSYVADYTLAEHDYEQTNVASTCSAQGYTLHKCKNCDDSYKDTFLPVAQHTYTSVQTKAPSCTEEGILTVTYTCACNTVYEDPIPKTAHVYTAGAVVAPTCTEKGYTPYTCTCGDSYNTNFVDATGHHHVAGTTVPATCTEKGYTVHTCTCGDSYTVETAALGHTIDAAAWTVVTDGEGNEQLTHVSGCTYERTYTNTCSVCQETLEKKEELTKHNYAVSITTVATCQAGGVKTFTCSVAGCGDSYTEAYTVEAVDGHKWSTATTTGSVETVYCTVDNCEESKTTLRAEGTDVSVNKTDLAQTGEVQMDEATVKMDEATLNQLTSGDGTLDLHASTLNDDLKNEVMNNVDSATQEKLQDKPIYNFTVNNGAIYNFDGLMTVTVPYTLADGEDAEGIVVWYINDEYGVDEIPATYTEVNGVGYAVFTTDHFSKYTVVRLTPSERCAIYNHDYKTREVKATCITDGYKLKYCIRCGYNETAEVYHATGHTYQTTVTAATCTTQGFTTSVCINANCGVTYVDNYVDALGHDYVSEEHTVTCTTPGYVEYSCNREGCGHSYQNIIEEALGHDYEDVETKPTCKDKGYTTHTCKHDGCNHQYKSDYKPKADHEYEAHEHEPTCYGKGYTRHQCKHCDEHYDDNYKNKKAHEYEEVVVEPTCTTKGYTMHVCKDENCKDSYKNNYKSEKGHKYGADFLCEECKAEHPAVNHGTKGFYITMRDSVMRAERTFFTVENFTFSQIRETGGAVSFIGEANFEVLKLTFAFDEDGYLVGHGEMRMTMETFDYSGNEVTDSDDGAYEFKVIFEGGKMYAFATQEMDGDSEDIYIVMSQDYMQEEIGAPLIALRSAYLELYSDNARKIIAAAMGITDKDIDEALGAITEFLFVKSETGAGYTFTLDADQIYNVVEQLSKKSVKELIETFFGKDQFDEIFEGIDELLDMTLGELEKKLGDRLSAAGYKIDDLYNLVNETAALILAEVNSTADFNLKDVVAEYSDVVIGEMLAETMDTSVKNLKNVISEVKELCETRSLVSIILEMSGEARNEEEAEQLIDSLLETIDSYLEYIGETSIKLTTDRQGNASMLTLKLDIEIDTLGNSINDGVQRKNTIILKGNGTIKFNDSYDMTFGDLRDEIHEIFEDLKFEDGLKIEAANNGISYVVYRKDNAMLIVPDVKLLSISGADYVEALGKEAIDGIEYNKYTVMWRYWYDDSLGYHSWNECYYQEDFYGMQMSGTCGDWKHYGINAEYGYTYYTVWAMSDGTIVRSELDWETTKDNLWHSSTFSFWYNDTTKEYSKVTPHDYQLLDSYETDECEKTSWWKYECSICGDVYIQEDRNWHEEYRTCVLVEGATSCEDGWQYVYKCYNCDYEEVEKDVQNYHNGNYTYYQVDTTCGEVRIEYYSCACGYHHNTYFYLHGDCNFEEVYVETKFDENGFPISNPNRTYKCTECGAVIVLTVETSEEGCQAIGSIKITYNNTVIIEKSYTVANHENYTYNEETVDGYLVRTKVCDKCNTLIETYKFDENGRTVYYANERGMGYRYEYEGCQYTKYYFNANGDYNEEEGVDHNSKLVIEVVEGGESCLDGIEENIYCATCGEYLYSYGSYTPDAHYFNRYEFEPTEYTIETTCGTATVLYIECACGEESRMYDWTAENCDMTVVEETETKYVTACSQCGLKIVAAMEETTADCITTQVVVVNVYNGGDTAIWSKTFKYSYADHNMETVESTDANGNRVETIGCTVCSMIEERTTYDQYDRVLRYERADGSGYYYEYDGCYYYKHYFDENGKDQGGSSGENHKMEYKYEFLTDSKNCEDGVKVVRGCSVCDYVDYEDRYYYHSEGSKVSYEHSTDCGYIELYAYNCPCNYYVVNYERFDIYSSCSFSSEGEGFDDTDTVFNRYLITYTCQDCGYVYTVDYYEQKVGCVVYYYLEFKFGVTADGCDETYTFCYEEAEHNIREEIGGTDDGIWLYECYCEDCETWFEHYEYKEDQYGRGVYYMDRLAGIGWEMVYGENCSYVKYTLDQAGNRGEFTEGYDHADYRYRYELNEGSVTCEDGTTYIRYCPECNYVVDTWQSSGHSTFEHIEEFTVKCGKVRLSYDACACGKVVDRHMNVEGSCNITHQNTESLSEYYRHWKDTYVCCITECGFSYTHEYYYYYEKEDDCLATYVSIYTLYNDGVALTTKTGSDKSTVHRWETVDSTDANGIHTCIEKCKGCGMQIIEKWDSYGRHIYYWNDNDGYGWKRDFVGCDYTHYEFNRNGVHYSYTGTEHVMYHDRYIQEACTQYGTYISYCRCCDYRYEYNYVTPSHQYEWNEELQLYVCARCGLENEKNVDGDFVVEDLTDDYGNQAYTAGFFNKLGKEWDMEEGYSFYIVLNYGMDNVKVTEGVKFDLFEYGYEYTGAAGSGIITLDMESLNAAITEAYGEDWAGFENVSIVFQVFDSVDANNQPSYVDHVLTFTTI